jgi:DNA-binding transcriptional ArsR family regulator
MGAGQRDRALISFLNIHGYLAKLADTHLRGTIMDVKTRALFEAQAAVIKAMAHPTRLFVVDQLSNGEKCVRDLTELVGADASTVSKHLSILKNAGIVRDDKRGTQVFYTLEMPCVLNFFSCVQSVIKSRAEEQMKLVP